MPYLKTSKLSSVNNQHIFVVYLNVNEIIIHIHVPEKSTYNSNGLLEN